MERSAVADAIKELHAAGKAASILNIKRQLGYGSKRDIVKHKRDIEQKGTDGMPETDVITPNGHNGHAAPWQGRVGLPLGEDIRPRRSRAPAAPPTPTPQPAPEPIVKSMSDPVEMAHALLEDAEAALDQARDLMDQAVQHLASSAGVLYQGRRLGAYVATDPAKDDLLARAIDAEDQYRQCMGRWEAAKDWLASKIREHRRAQQEQWIAEHAPHLVQERDHWKHRADHPTSGHDEAEAKKNYGIALQAYAQAQAQAPTTD
jgi:hypothetical protein